MGENIASEIKLKFFICHLACAVQTCGMDDFFFFKGVVFLLKKQLLRRFLKAPSSPEDVNLSLTQTAVHISLLQRWLPGA